ncbi:putative transmembrane protein, partial [Toxoplasma gondii RUB]
PLVDSIVSDFAFLESYLALATTMLIVRKYRNPYWLSSYCGPGLMRHCPEALKTVFIFQALLQLAILATATGKIALCWMTGYGTPMQILSAFILVSVVMWTVTVLSHVLQTEQMNPPLLPTLEYHWL